jgi:predicted PurR-regulated permease PerM
MSTPIIIIIFVAALVFSVGFLLLVISMVPAIQQFKSLMADLEKTSLEMRDLAREARRLGGIVEDRLEKVDMVLAQSRKAAENAGDAMQFINRNVLRRSAGLLAFLPAVRMGWKLVKKIKGGK